MFGGALTAAGSSASAEWLQAALSDDSKADWYSSLADMAAWKLADWEIAMRMRWRVRVRAGRKAAQRESRTGVSPSHTPCLANAEGV